MLMFNFLARMGLMVAVKTSEVSAHLKGKEKNLIREKWEAELKMLLSQTNPHFLFNTLNNIFFLTLKKSYKAPEAVMQLSELLSFMLYGTNKERIATSGKKLRLLMMIILVWKNFDTMKG